MRIIILLLLLTTTAIASPESDIATLKEEIRLSRAREDYLLQELKTLTEEMKKLDYQISVLTEEVIK